jgi:hypothetical protein
VTLEAGRELDALVAERVMGCRVEWHEGRPYCGDGVTCCYPHAEPDRDAQLSGDLAPYSTDHNAAMQVVAALARRGYWLRLQSPFAPGDPWFAGFTPHETSGWNGRPDFERKGDAAPVAICRASLLVVAALAATRGPDVG